MQLSLRSFNALVQSMAAAVEASATQLLDLTAGSTLRAVLEANASIGLWMQWLTLQVLRTTRAATSDGADLDSWMADLTLTRLPAVAATGSVTFSRFTPDMSALIPAGALIRTADGTQTFAVSVDTTKSSWSSTSNGYVVAAGVASLDLPVIALTPGSAGNVQGGTISLLASALPGIDSVSNLTTLQNGLDAESDDAFRDRFHNFIASRSRATPLAVGYAISSIQQGLNYTIQENPDPSGQPRMGSFVVTVDDGSGSPSTALLSTVQSAIDAVRPVGFDLQCSAAHGLDGQRFPYHHGRCRNIKGAGPGPRRQRDRRLHQRPAHRCRLPLTRLAQIAYSARRGGDKCQRGAGQRQRQRHRRASSRVS